MSERKLNPCVCGAQAVIELAERYTYITCSNATCARAVWASTRDEAIAMWNAPGRVTQLEEALIKASHYIYGEYYVDHPTCKQIRAALNPQQSEEV